MSVDPYKDYLDSKLSTFERVADKLSGADERLDYVVARLEEMQKAFPPGLTANLEALTAELAKGGFMAPKQTLQTLFQQNLLALQGVRLIEDSRLTGRITSVSFHWPLGTNALVDIAVGHGSQQFMPLSGFLALNDATPVFYVNEPIKEGEVMWCIMKNTDVLPHAVSVTVIVEGV